MYVCNVMYVMYVCMHVCMYAWMDGWYVCMYVWYVCMVCNVWYGMVCFGLVWYVCMYVCIVLFVCLVVGMYVCMYVGMDGCMYVCICMYMYVLFCFLIFCCVVLCMYVRAYVCMLACMYVGIHTIYIFFFNCTCYSKPLSRAKPLCDLQAFEAGQRLGVVWIHMSVVPSLWLQHAHGCQDMLLISFDKAKRYCQTLQVTPSDNK